MELYSIAEIAEWVKPAVTSLKKHPEIESSPYFFHLVDYQELINTHEIHSYRRTIEEIQDVSRIENASLNLVELEEENQRVIFHGLDVIRGDNRINALIPGNIEVIRREKSLEDHITDHRLTVSISIDDLRVGDLVESISTVIEIATKHPLKGKHYYSRFWLNWACPVLHQKISIYNQSNKNLIIHTHKINVDGPDSDEIVEIISDSGYQREYSNLMPKSIDDTAPNWIWGDFVIITTKYSWAELSRYMYNYYFESGALSDSFDIDIIDDLKLGKNRDEDLITIVRFVQDSIRYRGENHGIYTHTPRIPEKTLIKRYGDCKDKSNLMVAILKAKGVQANLALVNTDYGQGMNQFQPSAYCFNHMIVRVKINDNDYYFDATIQKQGGKLGNGSQLNYGYVLNLTEQGENLVKLPFDLQKKVFELNHYFDFSKGNEGEKFLNIERSYFGHRADHMRFYFASNEQQKINENFKLWAQDDTDLELSPIHQKSKIEDDKNLNILSTTETYKIENIKKTHGDNNIQILTEFYKDFPLPNSERYPVQTNVDGLLEHNIKIKYRYLKSASKIESEIIKNAYFEYEDKIWSRNNVLYFRTELIPSSDVIDTSDIHQYKIDAQKLRERYNNSFSYKSSYTESNWFQVIMVSLLLILALIAFNS